MEKQEKVTGGRAKSALKRRLGLFYLIVTNWQRYRYWREIRSGTKTIDWTRGAGYYFPIGLIGCNPIGERKEVNMASGKTGVYELISYDSYSDPDDMIKESRWHFVGYKDEKPIKQCSFPEFIEKYT